MVDEGLKMEENLFSDVFYCFSQLLSALTLRLAEEADYRRRYSFSGRVFPVK